MCLWSEGTDDDSGDAGGVRRVKGLSEDDGGIGRGQGICDASEGLETTTEVAGDRRWDRGIYNEDRDIEGGRLAQRLQQLQRMHIWRIDNASKGLKTTTEAAADQQRAWWIGNDNGVMIFLAFGLLKLTLSCLCLVAVSF